MGKNSASSGCCECECKRVGFSCSRERWYHCVYVCMYVCVFTVMPRDCAENIVDCRKSIFLFFLSKIRVVYEYWKVNCES